MRESRGEDELRGFAGFETLLSGPVLRRRAREIEHERGSVC